MRICLTGLLLFSLCAFGYPQGDPENGTIVFYANGTGPSRTPPIVYSENLKLGEVTPDHPVRIVVSPGVYYFALSRDEPRAKQLSVSIKGGQTIYLRVATDGFFFGNETEARDNQQSDAIDLANSSITTSPDNTGDVTSSGTIFFYRSSESRDSNQGVTVYGLFIAGSRRLATLQKGEYFAVKVPPGLRAFSWTVAPARGQQVLMNVSPGENVYNEVRSDGILPTSETRAAGIIDLLRPVDAARVFDNSVVVAATHARAPRLPARTPTPSRTVVATPKDSKVRETETTVPGSDTVATPPSDAAKRIQALMNIEQDESDVVLEAILSSSETADVDQLLDDSVESRAERIAKLKADLGEKQLATTIREVVNNLEARNEFMRAFKTYLQRTDLLLEFDQAAPEVIFDSYENECRNVVGSSREASALVNCEADRAKAELSAREARVAAAKRQAAAAWSSVVSDESGLTKQLEQSGLGRVSLGKYSKDILDLIK
jgi:hypothetical protein